MAALQRGGTKEAIPFCNIRAIPITDSMALATRAQIQRVTNKARNPKNKANKYESSLIEEYRMQLSQGEKLQPHSANYSGNEIYYFPILTNTMCLQCHGKPGEDVEEITLKLLKKYYPADEALGYESNEVRGLWKVTPNTTQ